MAVEREAASTALGGHWLMRFTDSNSPSWDNIINGQVNLYDAIRGQIDFKLGGKDYKLRTDRVLPTLIVRLVMTLVLRWASLLIRK